MLWKTKTFNINKGKLTFYHCWGTSRIRRTSCSRGLSCKTKQKKLITEQLYYTNYSQNINLPQFVLTRLQRRLKTAMWTIIKFEKETERNWSVIFRISAIPLFTSLAYNCKAYAFLSLRNDYESLIYNIRFLIICRLGILEK